LSREAQRGTARICDDQSVADETVPEPTAVQVGAFDAGTNAYNTGQPSTACPFRPQPDDTPDDVDLRILWIRGWVLARDAHLYGDVELPPTDPKLSAMKRWRIGRAP